MSFVVTCMASFRLSHGKYGNFPPDIGKVDKKCEKREPDKGKDGDTLRRDKEIPLLSERVAIPREARKADKRQYSH